ncbi:hypothetical protein QPK87_05675 [Kamptonema cortianum]|nr:hypothetical protein [Kamptonema cortianum]
MLTVIVATAILSAAPSPEYSLISRHLIKAVPRSWITSVSEDGVLYATTPEGTRISAKILVPEPKWDSSPEDTFTTAAGQTFLNAGRGILQAASPKSFISLEHGRLSHTHAGKKFALPDTAWIFNPECMTMSHSGQTISFVTQTGIDEFQASLFSQGKERKLKRVGKVFDLVTIVQDDGEVYGVACDTQSDAPTLIHNISNFGSVVKAAKPVSWKNGVSQTLETLLNPKSLPANIATVPSHVRDGLLYGYQIYNMPVGSDDVAQIGSMALVWDDAGNPHRFSDLVSNLPRDRKIGRVIGFLENGDVIATLTDSVGQTGDKLVIAKLRQQR